MKKFIKPQFLILFLLLVINGWAKCFAFDKYSEIAQWEKDQKKLQILKVALEIEKDILKESESWIHYLPYAKYFITTGDILLEVVNKENRKIENELRQITLDKKAREDYFKMNKKVLVEDRSKTIPFNPESYSGWSFFGRSLYNKSTLYIIAKHVIKAYISDYLIGFLGKKYIQPGPYVLKLMHDHMLKKGAKVLDFLVVKRLANSGSIKLAKYAFSEVYNTGTRYLETEYERMAKSNEGSRRKGVNNGCLEPLNSIPMGKLEPFKNNEGLGSLSQLEEPELRSICGNQTVFGKLTPIKAEETKQTIYTQNLAPLKESDLPDGRGYDLPGQNDDMTPRYSPTLSGKR